MNWIAHIIPDGERMSTEGTACAALRREHDIEVKEETEAALWWSAARAAPLWL